MGTLKKFRGIPIVTGAHFWPAPAYWCTRVSLGGRRYRSLCVWLQPADDYVLSLSRIKTYACRSVRFGSLVGRGAASRSSSLSPTRPIPDVLRRLPTGIGNDCAICLESYDADSVCMRST